MFGHLKATEFVDLIEGLDLSRRKASHLVRCLECRRTLESIGTMHESLDETGDEAAFFAGDIDFDALRSSVRDHLLSRAVKRSSVVQRWTGQSLTPAAAWGLASLLLIFGMTIGGFWHYRTSHISGDARDSLVTQAGNSVDSVEDVLLVGDAATMEVEAMAWSQTDFFTLLSELDTSEEETLRGLIAQNELSVIDEN